MSRRTRIALAAAVAALSLVVVVAPASAGQNGPNNENAKKCQSYLDWVRADGSAFQSSGECTAYAAKGGQLVAKPPPLSAGCDALNDPKLDARYGNAGINNASFNAGEVVTVMTTSGPNAGATAAVLEVNDVTVDAAALPATLTYTFPTSAAFTVEWMRIAFGDIDWLVSCASGS